MRRALIFAAAILFMSGCHGHPKPSYEPVNRGGYGYQRLDDGAYVVVARDHHQFELALDEIGCQKQFVCAWEQSGLVFKVVQTKKN